MVYWCHLPQALSFIRKFYPNSIELAQLSNSILHGVQPFCEFQSFSLLEKKAADKCKPLL